ncbi:MAG: shikimate dehydrogenase [Gammaproteobacteria bacterium]|nr:shikimate dehydrogenase [Gammaproteobacteria bacterium]
MTQKNIDRYAVIGNPISHSKSPLIHAEFAKLTRQTLSYTAELVEPGQVKNFITAFANDNGKGLNITVPFKLDAYELASDLTDRAKRAGAVNTLTLKDNKIFGDTTDGTGLLNDLIKNHQQIIKNKHVLILGAGGAVRGVLEPLLLENPASLVIANRTVSKAQQLTDDFSSFGNISACGFNELDNRKFDIIINGTSASLSGDLPPLPDNLFSEHACAYDMMYAKQATVFMQWAKQQGAEIILDGLGMLVEQAAESFYIWRGVRPETRTVIDMLKMQL